MPLRIRNPRLVSYLRTRYASNEGTHAVILGVIAKIPPLQPPIGTIIEAVATKFEAESAVLMAQGRYRFHLLTQYRDHSFHISMATIRILEDTICTYAPSATIYHTERHLATAANPWLACLHRRYHADTLMQDVNQLQQQLVRPALI